MLCIETTYIFKTFQLSALHRKEVQCNSMDKNVDQGPAVECTAAHPRLTKYPKEEENPCMFFSVSVLLLASVERFGVSRMRDFLSECFTKMVKISETTNNAKILESQE